MKILKIVWWKGENWLENLFLERIREKWLLKKGGVFERLCALEGREKVGLKWREDGVKTHMGWFNFRKIIADHSTIRFMPWRQVIFLICNSINFHHAVVYKSSCHSLNSLSSLFNLFHKHSYYSAIQIVTPFFYIRLYYINII